MPLTRPTMRRKYAAGMQVYRDVGQPLKLTFEDGSATDPRWGQAFPGDASRSNPSLRG